MHDDVSWNSKYLRVDVEMSDHHLSVRTMMFKQFILKKLLHKELLCRYLLRSIYVELMETIYQPDNYVKLVGPLEWGN